MNSSILMKITWSFSKSGCLSREERIAILSLSLSSATREDNPKNRLPISVSQFSRLEYRQNIDLFRFHVAFHHLKLSDNPTKGLC